VQEKFTCRNHKEGNGNRPNGIKVVVAGSCGSFRVDAQTASMNSYDA
jgi:hypothetical protein